VRQFAGFVVEDDVVGDVVGQEDDVPVGRAGEAVAVIDGRLFVEHAPTGDDAILEVALAEDFGRRSLREGAAVRPIPGTGEERVFEE